MKNLLLGALLSSGIMFANGGHSSSHSSSHSMSHSSAHVSSHTSGHSSFHSTSHSYPHSSTLHSDGYHPSAQHPYHRTSNIRASHVEFHPVYRYYYYPIMNHHTRTLDTIKGKTAEEVQAKVNSYNTEDDNDWNWFGLGCLVVIISGVVFFVYKSGK